MRRSETAGDSLHAELDRLAAISGGRVQRGVGANARSGGIPSARPTASRRDGTIALRPIRSGPHPKRRPAGEFLGILDKRSLDKTVDEIANDERAYESQ